MIDFSDYVEALAPPPPKPSPYMKGTFFCERCRTPIRWRRENYIASYEAARQLARQFHDLRYCTPV